MATATSPQTRNQHIANVKEYQTVSSIPLLPRDHGRIVKKDIITLTSEVESHTQDSCEDDDDVISVCVAKRKKDPPKTTSPYLSPNRNSYVDIEKNSIVKAFLRERKKFDPSWTLAAESVFSEAHPFKQKRRNRSQEQPETQEKEQIAFRSSSEPRCTSIKTQKRDLQELSKGERTHDENGEPRRQRQKRFEPQAPNMVKEKPSKEINAETASPAVKDTKSDSAKSGEDHKSSLKKKRISMSMVRQRHSTYITSERLLNIKSKVDAAIREHKVYSMTGHYISVRRALRERGWVEKIDSDFKGRRRTHRFEDVVDEATFQLSGKREKSENNENEHCQAEAEIVNRMLRNINEDLCWLSKPYPYCWKDMGKCDMVNRLPKAYFSNKVGLCNSLANMQWFYEPGVCSTQFPRTYNISMRDEYESFKDDFRLTACVSTLKWLTANYKKGGEAAVRSPDGRVDINIIDFALRRCGEYVKYKEHDDIDILEIPTTWEHQWDHFLTQYYKIVNEGHLLRENKEDPPTLVIVSNTQTMMNMMQPYWPQMGIEGINNFWIVKPGGRCCGNGILIRNHLEEIMDIVNPSITRETRYVVQKYIERPLLIYNTKFDIRQWFLVTNVYPLTIWMYKESYLRFCSSTFNLKNTHESIHLCNNAVQRRYKNGKRDRNLPDENMWDCYTFQTYLKAIGYPTVWEDVIYPGMKESFVGALLASQENMERRKNCFELYGADFMISDTLTDGPWLIEINSNPAMDSSTSITARMCPQVLEDIVKVVIDRRNDRNAPTGAFEMVFKQNCPPIPPYLGMSLSIRGKKIYKAPSESKNIRRPKYLQPASESDDSDSSSAEDENIVQKRCSKDFMQPIKTLREEIQRLGTARSREDLLTVRDEHYSDSAADTDTSRTSTDRRMALEGKEIELKKKRNRKRRQRVVQKLETKYRYRMDLNKPEPVHKKEELAILRKRVIDKKTDWVRRNIESIRGYNMGKFFERGVPHDSDDVKFLKRSQDNLDIYKDYIMSGQCFDEYKANHKHSNDVLEILFREEILKMLDAAEAKESKNDPVNEKNECEEAVVENQKPSQGPLIITGLWEPMTSNTDQTQVSYDEQDIDDKEPDLEPPESPRHSYRKDFLMVEGLNIRKSSGSEGPSRSLSCTSLNYDSDRQFTSHGEQSDCDCVESLGSSNRSLHSMTGPGDGDTNSMKYEQDLRTESYHRRVRCRVVGGDITKSLSIKAPDYIVKEREKSHRWHNAKTSMEYFKEWKYKIDETRRNCEDMLTKLRHFKESNSKIRYQDVLQRRVEEETRLLKKMKEYRLSKQWEKADVVERKLGKLNKQEISKIRNEGEKIRLAKESWPKLKAPSINDFTQKIYAANLRLKENRMPSYCGIQGEAPLAINSESGAVRNVNEVLPKVKLRNRPLLPNGASGHCRNVDQKKMNTRVKGYVLYD